MFQRVDFVAVAGSVLLLFTVLELIRRRRLKAEYSIFWLIGGVVLTGFSVSRDWLTPLSQTLGIHYPPSALFLLGFGLIVLVLLHFSVVVSQLSRENKELTERVAIIQGELQGQARLAGPRAERQRTTDGPSAS